MPCFQVVGLDHSLPVHKPNSVHLRGQHVLYSTEISCLARTLQGVSTWTLRLRGEDAGFGLSSTRSTPVQGCTTPSMTASLPTVHRRQVVIMAQLNALAKMQLRCTRRSQKLWPQGNNPWGGLQFSSRHQPPRRGRVGRGGGGGGMGGGRKIFSILGAFLNLPFHFEHCQDRYLSKPPWGGDGGGSHSKTGPGSPPPWAEVEPWIDSPRLTPLPLPQELLDCTPAKHGGFCNSVLYTNPRGVGGGGGGQSKNFLHFACIFEFPISF